MCVFGLVGFFGLYFKSLKSWRGEKKTKNKLEKLNPNLNFCSLYEYLLNNVSPVSSKFSKIAIVKEKENILKV